MAGTLRAGDAREQLGGLILAGDAVIDLGGGNAKLSFASSRGEEWNSNAILMVANWDGAPSGGGEDQLTFGTDESGLGAGQLERIRFIDPAGFPPGAHRAAILATGEVVPVARPALAGARAGKNLMLIWESSFQLESSTNVAGPYVILPGAISPHTIEMTASPQRFFRIRDNKTDADAEQPALRR